MSSKWVQGGIATFTAGEAISAYQRVRITSTGTVLIAGVQQNWDGVAEQTVSSGDLVAVRLRNSAGTLTMIASAAVAAGAIVYPAASGKISSAGVDAGTPLGRALQAATADGAQIEVLQFPPTGLLTIRHVVTVGEDGANQVDIAHNMGVTPTGPVLAFIKSTGNVLRPPQGAITFPDVNTVRIADTGLAVNEEVLVLVTG